MSTDEAQISIQVAQMNAEWFFYLLLTRTEQIVSAEAENQFNIILMDIAVEIVVSFTS